MKPQAIEERFADQRDLPLAELLPRLVCGTPKGCGSHDMILFPWCEPPDPPARTPKPAPAQLPF